MPTELYRGSLADVIARAAKSTVVDPREAKLKARFENTGDDIFLLVDISGSMLSPIGDTTMSKFDHAQIAVDDVLAHNPKIRVVAFDSWPREVKGGKLPQPAGSTCMGDALEYVAKFRPQKTIIVSDGLPDDEQGARDAAEKMTGRIDTIYCGPDGHPAITFLRSLCRIGCGRHSTWEGRGELTGAIRALLSA
jgi:hypothetical protein